MLSECESDEYLLAACLLPPFFVNLCWANVKMPKDEYCH